MKRRAFLGTTAVCAAVPIGAIPWGYRQASLAANVTIRGYQADDTNHIYQIDLTVTNNRPRDGAVIKPAFLVWGVNRQSQSPWVILNDESKIRPGERRQFRIRSPGEQRVLRLINARRAQVACYDIGTEERAVAQFTPTAPEADSA